MKTDLDRLPRDARENPIQVPTTWVAGSLYQTSPMTVSSVEKFIDIPENAVAVVIQASGADLRVSHGVGGTATVGCYDIIYSGTKDSYPVSLGRRIYLLRNASTDVTATFKTWFVGA